MLNPGPGNYKISRDLGKISYSFGGKGPSMLVGTKGSPGPGTYSVGGSFANIPGSKIGTGLRNDELRQIIRQGSPGPAHYNTGSTLSHHATIQDAPCYGFGTESRDRLAGLGSACSPGPGAYNHRNVVGYEGSKVSMHGGRPMTASCQSPGPGAYTPHRESSAKQRPQYSIGKESRDGGLGLKHQRYTPAPGMYSPSSATLRKSPSWGVGTAHR